MMGCYSPLHPPRPPNPHPAMQVLDLEGWLTILLLNDAPRYGFSTSLVPCLETQPEDTPYLPTSRVVQRCSDETLAGDVNGVGGHGAAAAAGNGRSSSGAGSSSSNGSGGSSGGGSGAGSGGVPLFYDLLVRALESVCKSCPSGA